MVPVWPKCSTPSAWTRWPCTLPSHDKVAGWPSMTVTRRAVRASGAKQALHVRGLPLAVLLGHLGCLPAGVEAVGGRHGEEAGAGHALQQFAHRGGRFFGHRALVGDGQFRAFGRWLEPVAALDDVVAHTVVDLAHRLLQGPRRQAQIDRAAVMLAQPVVGFRGAGGALDVFEGPLQDHRQFVDERRLEAREPVLGHADERARDRLVRPAFRRQRDARRRRHQDEPGLLVAGVVEGIEAAGDERVVERADGDQALAEQLVRQPERGEQDEQVVLRDAQLDVLAVRPHVPALHRHELAGLEHVLDLVAGEDAAAVDPGPEVGRHGDVGRAGDDALGQLRVRSRDLVARIWPKPCWVDMVPRIGGRGRGPGSIAFAVRRRGPLALNGTVDKSFSNSGSERLRPATFDHSWPSRMLLAALNLCIWSGVISPAWLSLWPANGRPCP
jgi:hypothetical protein